jgi:hypothetical protein
MKRIHGSQHACTGSSAAGERLTPRISRKPPRIAWFRGMHTKLCTCTVHCAAGDPMRSLLLTNVGNANHRSCSTPPRLGPGPPRHAGRAHASPLSRRQASAGRRPLEADAGGPNVGSPKRPCSAPRPPARGLTASAPPPTARPNDSAALAGPARAAGGREMRSGTRPTARRADGGTVAAGGGRDPCRPASEDAGF